MYMYMYVHNLYYIIKYKKAQIVNLYCHYNAWAIIGRYDALVSGMQLSVYNDIE